MKKKSIISMAVAVGLTAVIGVGATLAYLSSTTDTLTNTFTVGKVSITQDESNIKTDDPNDRTSVDQDYGVLEPSQSVVKDPTVTVAANSVESYVFMKVTGVDQMIDAGYTVEGWSTDWTKLEGSGTLDGIYVYKGTVKSNAAAQKLAPLFQTVALPETWTGTSSNWGGGAKLQITVQSAAVQATGHANNAAALTSAKEVTGW